MRVVQIGVAHPFRGGIAHYTASLHQALLQGGHSSSVISFSRLYPSILFPGRSQYDNSSNPFPIADRRLLDSLNPLSWRAAATRIAEDAADVAVFQYWHPYFAPAYGAIVSRLRSRQIPAIFICHNVTPHERHPVALFLRDRLFGKVDRFLVHSEKDREILRSLQPSAAIFKARHPVYEFFGAPQGNRVSARLALGLSPDEKVILFFGHVRPYKGLEILLRSLPRVLKRQPVRLLIAGEFYESRSRYERLIGNLGLQAHVTVHDRYIPNERVALYFRAANLLVLPYRSATQSGIIPTAYSFDLPVVTTSVGGLPEAVQEGRTGFLVPPDNPAALSETIADFFQSGREAQFREQIGHFKKQFSWNQIVEGIEYLARLEQKKAAVGQAR
jgi:glycosyltransferase involved in cell wall biosynthesis